MRQSRLAFRAVRTWGYAFCPHVTVRTALVVERCATAVDHVKLIRHACIGPLHRFPVVRTLEKLLGGITVLPHTMTGELTATGRRRKSELHGSGRLLKDPDQKSDDASETQDGTPTAQAERDLRPVEIWAL